MHRFFLPALIFSVLFGNAQNYKKLHRNAIVVDTHNDIPSATIEKKVQFDSDLKGKTHSVLDRMKKGGIGVQIFSIFLWARAGTPLCFC